MPNIAMSGRIPTSILWFLLWPVLISIAGCCNAPSPGPNPPEPPAKSEMDASDVAQNNRGVALMLQFNYSDALDVFSALAQKHPHELDLQVNQAIAQLNRQQSGDVEAALTTLERVLEEKPGHQRALFCRGLLLLYRGDADQAAESFSAVTDQDASDAFAAYWFGQSLAEGQNYEEALKWYEKAAELDPYLRSAYYGSFVALRQLGRSDQAKEKLEDYERLKHNLLGRLAEFKYTRMGSKGEAVSIGTAERISQSLPKGPAFAQMETLQIDGAAQQSWQSAEGKTPSVTVADINRDGQLDLYVTGLQVGDGLANAVCLRNGEALELQPDHPLAKINHVNAALWGDCDNDGRTDVYLCRDGENQLWRVGENETWEDVTVDTGTAAGSAHTIDGAMYDADHDGDLDLLLVNADGVVDLLNNNRDGTFQSIAEELGLESDGRPVRSLIVADLDNDRDMDIVIVKQQPPHEILINDRAWNYRAAGSGFDALTNAEIDVAVSADLDNDGLAEIVAASGNTITSYQPNRDGRWQTQELASLESLSAIDRLVVQDVQGDGQDDLIVADPEGWVLVTLSSDDSEPAEAFHAAELAGLAIASFNSERGVSVVGLRDGQPPAIWRPGQGRFKFVEINYVGRTNEADQLRSNASGIGVHTAARIDSRRISFAGIRNSSGPGQSLMPLSIGLGGSDAIDYVTLRWPDGVLQTEISVAPGAHTFSETQRQLSSCPVLFCHNGEEFAFVTDLLGVGGMGFAIGRNEYAPSTPQENVLLPEGALAAVGGSLRLKLTEPMEEACYLDHVQLVAYDLPPMWQMTIDERMNIAGPKATGKPVFYRQSLQPIAATNDRGDNVLSDLKSADQKAAPPASRDSRFLGRTENHWIELTFAAPLDEFSQPTLLAHGWVEYPYSQTMFAAWQANAAYEAPTIEALAADGDWVTVLEQFGYPAGMPREMSVPLEGLPKNCRKLRITTNQEIYWDHLVVIDAEVCAEVKVRALTMEWAELAECGFPAWNFGPERRPHFNWTKRSPLWDTRHQSGNYTQFGRVEPLVSQRDSAVAIIGPGEEVEFHFATSPEPPADGWTRRYVLETAGWCKDMDMYTQDGETVGPLPTHKELTPQEAVRRDELHRNFNTRYRSGY